MKSFLFKLLDLIIFFRPKDGTIIQRLSCVDRGPTHERMVQVNDGGDETWYTFGGKIYRTRTWPVKKTGFVLPWTKCEPHVPWFHSYAGPKRDFHGSEEILLPLKIQKFPYLDIIFTQKGFSLKIMCGFLFKYSKPLKVTNLIGQTTETSLPLQ